MTETAILSKARGRNYRLGQRYENGGRFIAANNVTGALKPGSTRPTRWSCSPSLYTEYRTNLAVANGRIDDFKQGRRGDCYFLAAIYSICAPNPDGSITEGEKELMQNIQKNADGSYTVKLPGAIEVREYYESNFDKDKVAITGEYTITAAAINKAKNLAGKSYAYGDIEVILLELAMEAYRAEIIATRAALGLGNGRDDIAGMRVPEGRRDTLSGGFEYDAIFILTGKRSDHFWNPRKKESEYKPYKKGEYGYVTPGENAKTMAPFEVRNSYDKDSEFQKMLDECQGHEDEYMMTFSVFVAENGPDGTTRAGDLHALSVVEITDEYVEVVNPWDTTKRERIPRGDFEKMVYSFTATPRNPSTWDYITDFGNDSVYAIGTALNNFHSWLGGLIRDGINNLRTNINNIRENW